VLFDKSPLLHRTTQYLLHTLLLFLCGTQLATAATNDEENRWYNVEVIIFSQDSQQFRDSELWPMDVPLPKEADARSLRPAVRGGAALTQASAFTLIPNNELTLNGEAARISSAPELKMLLHLGWRQPGLSQDQAVSIRVHDGMLEDGSINSRGMAIQPAEPYRMEGTLKLVLSRYLHIYADLLYREPQPENATPDLFNGTQSGTSTDAAAMPSTDASASQADLFAQAAAPLSGETMPRYRIYHLQQSRRMRSGELHYIDHPVLGLIIRVTPYEPNTSGNGASS